MGGGLMQLVAYGAQDIYLTGNPQITFFKVVYRRHTNFAMEAIEQSFNGAAELGKKFSCTISRNGDLLHKVYLEIDMSKDDDDKFIGRTGYQLIDYVDLEIGGQCIDKHYGEWMDAWSQLSAGDGEFDKLNRMLTGDLVSSADSTKRKIYVPLQFWFCKNPGLALPLIALQYHEVKINIQFKDSFSVVNTAANPDVIANNRTTSEISNCCVFCDYIFLDTDERRRFAQVSHEYLIEQVQFSNAISVSDGENNTELRFNHPVKELVWVCKKSSVATVHNQDYLNGSLLGCDSALLQLNGQDRFKRREGSYFALVQPYQHHTGRVAQQGASATKAPLGGMCVYSFSLKPEEHQPSGTCNFSRIDNAVLNVKTTGVNVMHVYAINYNVLRIMSGMGGLAYSN